MIRSAGRTRRWIAGAVAAATVGTVLALGPRVRFEEAWVEPTLPDDLDAWLAEAEAGVPDLREGDERAIVWLDPEERAPTPLSIVYLHGFSADRHEMEPVISELAAELGANLYFSRLAGHGRDRTAMAEATVEAWLADTAEALAIGGRIGERVLVVGTSTGGTLATWAATRPEAADRLAGIVLVSPNFQPRDRSSRMLLYPWGGQLARAVVGAERCFTPENDRQERHWTTCYPTSVLPVMMALVEHVRTMDLAGITVPTLVLYSPDDEVVDPLETYVQVTEMTGTKPRVQVVRSTSDPAHHVLAGDIVSPESNSEVVDRILDFLRSSLDLDE